MEPLFFTDEFTVNKTNTTQQDPTQKSQIQTFTIKFQTNSDALLKILLKSKLLPPTTMITDQGKTLILRASTITNLDGFYENQYKTIPLAQVKNLRYETDLRIKHDLVKQFIAFLKNHYIFFAFSLKNIVVLNERTFLYLSNEHLVKMDPITDPKQIPTITLKTPFKREYEVLFISEEIREIQQLPYRVNVVTLPYWNLLCPSGSNKMMFP